MSGKASAQVLSACAKDSAIDTNNAPVRREKLESHGLVLHEQPIKPGMQAVLGHDPPMQRRSMTATRQPRAARGQTAGLVPVPLPRMRRSDCAGLALTFI
jgi:hypothetical protein